MKKGRGGGFGVNRRILEEMQLRSCSSIPTKSNKIAKRVLVTTRARRVLFRQVCGTEKNLTSCLSLGPTRSPPAGSLRAQAHAGPLAPGLGLHFRRNPGRFPRQRPVSASAPPPPRSAGRRDCACAGPCGLTGPWGRWKRACCTSSRCFCPPSSLKINERIFK